MECVAIESQALKAVTEKINEVAQIVENQQAQDEQRLQDQWIENSDFAKILGLSLKTLQGYRERGVIGYSIVGRKIYYKRSDVILLLNPEKNLKRQ